MVAKGPAVGAVKAKKFADRKDRSLCVTIFKPLEMEKSAMEIIIKTIHPGIERVYFPRQKRPKFFFALCKDKDTKEDVCKAFLKFKSEEFGRLVPKKVLEKEVQPVKEVIVKTKKSENPLTLVLEAIPKSLETDALKAEFSSCKRIFRFNDRRCYIYFKNVSDAFSAFQKVKSEPILGYKLLVKFDKIQKPKETKDAMKEKKSKTVKIKA